MVKVSALKLLFGFSPNYVGFFVSLGIILAPSQL